jgi:hypothetical protein
VDPADTLLSRGKEPPPKGQQSRQSRAEQQQRAASIRHAIVTAIERTILPGNHFVDRFRMPPPLSENDPVKVRAGREMTQKP